jgi:hypothetical protein
MPFAEFTSDKVLGKQAQQLYKRHLNRLAEEDITTKTDLLKKRRKTIAAIKKLAPGDDDKARAEKRRYLSAIFWVLHGEKFLETKNNIYYKLFKKNIQNYGKPTETPRTTQEASEAHCEE